ncbi:ANTAR domain-containing protein [Terrabacter aerolatus]|uniref:ANTAR domain-containing protein n=1 Tax=Terrabacter aerolatus TaxID=422442 RepID=UPI0011BFCB4D|nr:ANTAR domain-containing protein [Terrabacter aerolatus]
MSESTTAGRPEAEQTGASRASVARRPHGLDLAVAVDLVMIERGLSEDEAYELMRRGAERSGRDLRSVADDVIDLGTSRLPR